MSDNNHHENEASPAAGVGGLAQSIGTRNLWIIILTMPAVFLVAVAAIIAIFGKPKKDEAELGAPVAVEDVADVDAAPTDIAALALAPGETVGAIALDGDRLAVRVAGPDGVVVVIYDIVKGEEIARIPVK